MFNEMKSEINSFLLNYFKNKGTFNKVIYDSASYSLNIGGKRIRPLLMLLTYNMYKNNWKDIIEFSAAIEMIHTYSLIHDDLPCMDNDDLRRGKPTCHKQFGEATAILAGDGLLNEAVNIIIKTSLASDLKIALISCLYQASGISGMIYGQELDIENENKKLSIDKLNTIHHYKTGKLLSCAFQLGGLIASPQDVKVLKEIGYKVGLAFQIQDDILDVISDSKTLGKPVGSDASNHKETYTTLIGVEASQKEVDKLFKEAIKLVYSLSINHGLIIEIIELLWKRVS